MLYLVERSQSLGQSAPLQLAKILDVPPNHRPNFRETLTLLKKALVMAQAKPDLPLARRVMVALARLNLEQFRLEEAHRYLNDAIHDAAPELIEPTPIHQKDQKVPDAVPAVAQPASVSSKPGDPQQPLTAPAPIVTTDPKTSGTGLPPLEMAQILISRAIVEYYQGELTETQTSIQLALDLLGEPEHLLLRGGLVTMRGAIYCYLGQYDKANDAFAQGRQLLTSANDKLLLAWHEFIYAREYERDQSNFRQALEHLESALTILKGQVGVLTIIENMLALADLYLHLRDLDRAQTMVTQAETLIQQNNLIWYLTELNILKGNLALAQENIQAAEQALSFALGGIGNNGDLRLLTPVYNLLARVFEHDRERNADVSDSLQRAITAGRVRARRLHLAEAIRHLGKHLRRPNYRPVFRARGGGYLFEADRMFIEMGLPRPPISEL